MGLPVSEALYPHSTVGWGMHSAAGSEWRRTHVQEPETPFFVRPRATASSGERATVRVSSMRRHLQCSRQGRCVRAHTQVRMHACAVWQQRERTGPERRSDARVCHSRSPARRIRGRRRWQTSCASRALWSTVARSACTRCHNAPVTFRPALAGDSVVAVV